MPSLSRYRLPTLTTLLCIASTIGWLGDWHFLLDLFNHFKLQYILLLFCLLPFLLWQRRWLWTGIAIVGIALNSWLIAPYYINQTTTPPNTTELLKILQFNLHGKHNRQFDEVITLLEQQQAHLVSLQEIRGDWNDIFPHLETIYPYQILPNPHSKIGIALLSKLPLDNVERIYNSETKRESYLVRFNWQDQSIHLITTHVFPPMTPQMAVWRDQQIAEMGRLLQAQPSPKILVGDLNATPWSRPFVNLLQQTQLQDSRLGMGLLPSWTTTFPTPLRIPIDHILPSPEVTVHSLHLAPYHGSDHLPLIAEFSL